MIRTAYTFAFSAALALASLSPPAIACEGDDKKDARTQVQAPAGSQTVTYTVDRYKFDAVRQAWSAASQFEFGAWTHPNVTLARGEGAFI